MASDWASSWTVNVGVRSPQGANVMAEHPICCFCFSSFELKYLELQDNPILHSRTIYFGDRSLESGTEKERPPTLLMCVRNFSIQKRNDYPRFKCTWGILVFRAHRVHENSHAFWGVFRSKFNMRTQCCYNTSINISTSTELNMCYTLCSFRPHVYIM